MENIAIKVENVSKSFKLPHEKSSSLKASLINIHKTKRGYENQHVLNNVSFEVKKGEFFGIVGRNGSGKSTLLKLLAEIYRPDQGTVQINGKLTPFIELGVGFSPELSGRDNVFLNGALLGFSRDEIENMYDDIVEFAELGRFMDQKLKNYSSGMQVRLAFSIAIKAKSDILLIDEVLAVGDAAFQTKCFDYFYKLKKDNATVVFVSHDQGAVERFCDRAILVDKGKIIQAGDVHAVLSEYSQIVMGELAKNADKEKQSNSTEKKRVDYAKITDVQIQNEKGDSSGKYVYGSKLTIKYKVNIKKKLSNPIMGVTIWRKNVDQAILATNTLLDGIPETGQFNPGDTIELEFELPKNLNNGEYYIEPALANESATVFYDQIPKAKTFHISGGSNPHSINSFESKMKMLVK